MNAVQLHDYDEEIVGTILVEPNEYKNEAELWNYVTESWDEYLNEEEDPDIYEFAEKYDLTVLSIDFYQPSENRK